jgi:sterol 24-C-methyltransferase
MSEIQTPGIVGIHQDNTVKDHINKEIKEYKSLFDDNKDASFTTGAKDPNKRQENYQVMIHNFYDLVTDFYEYGWGESFHFAPRHSKESFDQSIARSEQYVALRLGLKPGMKVIDCGCGVGGPMREIARFSGAEVIGVNISDYQIDRANKLSAKYGVDNCKAIKGDFMDLPFKEEFDAGYAIEATCHAPDKVKCYRSIFNTLKPGAMYCTYEWCMTDKYDPNNADHVRVRKGIEKGNALPDIPHTSVVLNAFKEVGFEILDVIDFGTATKQNPIPWYDTLAGRMTISNFRFTRMGRWLTHKMVSGLEYIKIAPSGSTETAKMLNDTADALVEGGEKGIFTPSFFVVCRKPSK